MSVIVRDDPAIFANFEIYGVRSERTLTILFGSVSRNVCKVPDKRQAF